MFLRYCTITGVDEKTDIEKLYHLTEKYPFVEWGFLYSPSKEGTHPRYPTSDFINHVVVEELMEENTSLHICGKGIENIVFDRYFFPIDIRLFPRVQLNFSYNKFKKSPESFFNLMANYPKIKFITQHNKNNQDIWKSFLQLDNHHLLYDSSGGRGIFTKYIPQFINGIFCGYAGGIGPDNIENVLGNMSMYSDGVCWVDMESGVRDENDYLDLDKVEFCLEKASKYAVS